MSTLGRSVESTPLAGLRLRAELALRASGARADSERRGALEEVLAQEARLSGVIDTLVSIARQELDPAEGTVDLVALAREVEGVEVRGDRRVPRAEGDPAVVRRALAPLLDNARRHARERVCLELSAEHGRVSLAVLDDGPGVDPALGERVFDPGVRNAGGGGAGGAGLGLSLARRLAARAVAKSGWGRARAVGSSSSCRRSSPRRAERGGRPQDRRVRRRRRPRGARR